MDKVCRACRDGTVTLVDIFKNGCQQDEPSLADMLNECTSCEYKRNDELPQKICISCVLAAQNAFSFKRKCEESQQHFRQLLIEKDNAWLKQEQNPEDGIVEESWQEELPPIIDSCVVKPVFVDCDAAPNDKHVFCAEDSTKDNALVCPTCGKEFSTRRTLVEHKCNHDRKTKPKSTPCPKKTINTVNLEDHKRADTGARRYKCPHCVKAFNQRGRLTEHIRSHTGERPYKCPYCPKTFDRQGYLAVHKRSHTPERLYECNECSSTFTQRSTLQKHMSTHTNSAFRTRSCSICFMPFSASSYLERHMKNVHSGASNSKYSALKLINKK